MNKSELVDKLYRGAEDDLASKAAANRAVDRVFEVIAEALEKGNEVKIPGFGRFFTKERKARTARNPATGDPIEVPAKNMVKFKVASRLSTRVDT